MARQKGIINLEGKAGSLSFYKSRDGLAARTAEGVSGSRIKNDAGYARTRENGFEFGRAGKGGKLLRDTLRPYMGKIGDGRVASRLTAALLKVIKTDSTNDRGARQIKDGDLSQLVGFEFNVNAPLTQSIIANFSPTIDRDLNQHTIVFPPFVPTHMVNPPQGATHFKLVAGVIATNFEEQLAFPSFHFEGPFSISTNPIEQIELQMAIPVSELGELPIFMVLAIEFLQVINNKEYPLNSGTRNAMSIVAIG